MRRRNVGWSTVSWIIGKGWATANPPGLYKSERTNPGMFVGSTTFRNIMRNGRRGRRGSGGGRLDAVIRKGYFMFISMCMWNL